MIGVGLNQSQISLIDFNIITKSNQTTYIIYSDIFFPFIFSLQLEKYSFFIICPTSNPLF